VRVLRERLAEFLFHQRLEFRDDPEPGIGIDLGVETEVVALLVILQDLLELMVVEPEHDIGVHLDEPPVTVIGKAAVAGLPGDRLDGAVVQTEVEDRVHHARHGDARARADRHQKRMIGIAEFAPGRRADRFHGRNHLLRERVRRCRLPW
jgi:hypothetical protein